MKENSYKNLIGKNFREKPELKRTWESLKSKRDLALILVQMRRAAGLTQAEVAKKANWRQPQVARLESLNDQMPQLNTIAKFAKICGAHLEIQCTFQGGEGEQNEKVLLVEGQQKVKPTKEKPARVKPSPFPVGDLFERAKTSFLSKAGLIAEASAENKPDIENWLNKVRLERQKIYGQFNKPTSPEEVQFALVRAQEMATTANQILARCVEASRKLDIPQTHKESGEFEVTLGDASLEIAKASKRLEGYTHIPQSYLMAED